MMCCKLFEDFFCFALNKPKFNHYPDNFVYVCINVTNMTLQEESNISSKPRRIRWWMWLIASPFLVFLLAILLLYLPPVQRFAVDKVSAIASRVWDAHLGSWGFWEEPLALTRSQKFTPEAFVQCPLLLLGWPVPKSQLSVDPTVDFLSPRHLSQHAPHLRYICNTFWKGDRRLKLGVPEDWGTGRS